MLLADRIQQRRDTAVNWASANPVLAQAEMGLETDTLKIKFGNGILAWNSLPYYSSTNITSFTDKLTDLVNNDKFLISDSQDSGTAKLYSWLDLLSQDKYYAEANTLTTTTNTGYQTKLTLSTTNLPIGTYILYHQFSWYYTHTGRAFLGRVRVNGATTVQQYNVVPSSNNSARRHPASGLAQVTFASVGNQSFTIEYATSNSGDTAGVTDARLLLVRIG